MGNISEKRNELEHARHELEEAQNEGNLEKQQPFVMVKFLKLKRTQSY